MHTNNIPTHHSYIQCIMRRLVSPGSYPGIVREQLHSSRQSSDICAHYLTINITQAHTHTTTIHSDMKESLTRYIQRGWRSTGS